MNDDLISRQAAIDAVCDFMCNGEGLASRQNCDITECCGLYTILQDLPSAQPKTGRWIDITVGDVPAQACDQCKTFYPLAYTGGGHHYCPNCGAKMEGGAE